MTGAPLPDQLNGLDYAFWSLESDATPMHVGGLAIYDPSTRPDNRFDRDVVVEHVAAVSHLAKPFRKKLSFVPLGLDHPYWIDDPDFDPRRHVRSVQLETPGNWESLRNLVSDLIAEPMRFDRPLWEFIVIEGLGDITGVPTGAVAILSKAHHMAIDGASGVAISAVTHSTEADDIPAAAAGPQDQVQPLPAPGLDLKLRRWLGNSLTGSVSGALVAGRLAGGTGRVLAGAARGEVSPRTPRNPRTSLGQRVTSRRSFGAARIDLAEVSRLRAAVDGATINDVVLAIVGGAVRRTLERIDRVPDSALTAMVPVALRTPSSADATGNDVANVVMSLGTNLADPIERLAAVHRRAVEAKAVSERLGARHLTDAAKIAPSLPAHLATKAWSTFAAGRVPSPGPNITVTNVPGPRVPLYFAGAELVAQYNYAPIHHGMTLVHTVFSYRGLMTIAFNTCPDVVDGRAYEHLLIESATELSAAYKP